MTAYRSTEIGTEVGESSLPSRHLETLDDIPREIAEKRMVSEFPESVSGEKLATLREIPDVFEKPEEFAKSANEAGLHETEGVLGYSTKLEDPAHILKDGDVGKEIATLIHEDLHRMTHPETLREMRESRDRRDLYEGVTEYLTEKAAEDLHSFQPGECYPEQVESARQLAAEVGDQALRDWFFKHELTNELRQALDRLHA